MAIQISLANPFREHAAICEGKTQDKEIILGFLGAYGRAVKWTERVDSSEEG